MKFPKEIKILGIPYKVKYCNNPSNVDIHKRESLWGQIDFWTKTIRIYGDDCYESMWQTIWHEIIHGIIYTLKIKFNDDRDEEEVVDLLATGINDIILNYFKFKGNERNGKLSKKTKKAAEKQKEKKRKK